LTTLDSTPSAHDSLSLDGATYHFTPHPMLPAATREPYVMEGAEAVVYQARREADGALFALKAPKPAYRTHRAVVVTEALARLADAAARDAAPGFAVARRVCLTRATHPDALARWPALEYAALMPWVAGQSWASLLLDRYASQAYTADRARTLATALATALWRLEGFGAAHTDLAGDNLILTPDGHGVELLDLEGAYLPDLPRPDRVSVGTAGYQLPVHAQAPTGAGRRRWRWRQTGAMSDDLWRPEGDRFAAAILLVELIVWADPAVRAATPVGAESLFQPGELGQTSRAGRADGASVAVSGAYGPTRLSNRLAVVRAALDAAHPPLLELFERAWAASDLRDCPGLGEWALALIPPSA